MFDRLMSAFYNLSGEQRAGMLIGFLLVENNITMLPNVGSLYYGFMLLALLYMLKRQQLLIGSLTMFGLYLVCLTSIWINDVPALFQPYPRLLTFLLITLLVSPALSNDSFTQFRSQSFVIILKLLPYVIGASVIYGMMGGGYGRHKYFQGITNHSMLLGPFAALCTLFCVYCLIVYAQEKKKRIYYGVLILCSLYCLLQAASRTALIGTIVSCIVFLAVYYRNQLAQYFKVIITICFVLVLSFPIWGRYMDKLQEKNGEQTELNTDSREVHWQRRWTEFKESPLWGIGFSSVSTNVTSGSTIGEGGKAETGSSWLSILSMTGILGFCAFLYVFALAFWKAWNLWYEIPVLSGFLIAILCFWALHMMAEGYIFAGGNSLGLCVWLVLGVIYGVSNNKEWAYELHQKLVGQE